MESASNSPKVFRIKRRLEALYSPASAQKQPEQKSSKSQARARASLDFSNYESTVQLTYSTSEQFVDENSCDSGFYDSINKDESNVSVTLDVVEKFDSKLSFDSPFLASKTKLTRHFKAKSKSFSATTTTTYDETTIKQALDNHHSNEQDERFVGDMSRKHTLPILNKSKHNDLASITPSTLADLLNGKYQDKIGSYMILDARYPYEFEGGHIHCAENVYLKDQLFEKLFQQPLKQDNGKPVVLIFHCEFSSERGPKLMREIRERDRLLNQANYPSLHYPEIYLLEGGYKDFYHQHDDLCLPKSYLPMLHDNHRNELKFFRKKSKTWEIETRKQRFNKNKLSF